MITKVTGESDVRKNTFFFLQPIPPKTGIFAKVTLNEDTLYAPFYCYDTFMSSSDHHPDRACSVVADATMTRDHHAGLSRRTLTRGRIVWTSPCGGSKNRPDGAHLNPREGERLCRNSRRRHRALMKDCLSTSTYYSSRFVCDERCAMLVSTHQNLVLLHHPSLCYDAYSYGAGKIK